MSNGFSANNKNNDVKESAKILINSFINLSFLATKFIKYGIQN